MAKIKIEGQTIPIEDEIARDDELLKAALAPSWPDARNATFKREGGKDGAELVVTVAKKAGTKGSIVADLLAAPDYTNPALVMQQRLEELSAGGKLTWKRALQMREEITEAARAGSDDLHAVNGARKTLEQADAQASNQTPTGF